MRATIVAKSSTAKHNGTSLKVTYVPRAWGDNLTFQFGAKSERTRRATYFSKMCKCRQKFRWLVIGKVVHIIKHNVTNLIVMVMEFVNTKYLKKNASRGDLAV